MRAATIPLLLAALLGVVAIPPGRAEDAPRVVLHMDFGGDDPARVLSHAEAEAAAALLTTDPAEEVGGKKSLKGDSRGGAAEWNEFFHSKTGLLAPKEAYQVSFDYRVIARAANAKFYVLARRAGSSSGSAGWKEWAGEPGNTGHVETSFTTPDADDILIFGIQNQGALAINDLTLTAIPALRPPDLPAPKRTWKSPGGTAYYVDSVGGSDANDGHSIRRAWRSLGRVNAGVFGPGDRILLKAGSRWSGFLSPGGSGAEGRLIAVSRYGSGPLPMIDAQGKSLATVYLFNSEYWDISGLDIANHAPARVPNLAGVEVRLDNFGVAHDIRLHDLDVHDVFGSNVKSEGGGNGISCSSGGSKVKTRYDGLVIEGCRLTRTDRNGITMSAYYPRPSWPLSTHVVIRGNTLTDIGGDGIVPIGCDGCLIEHNVLRGGRMRALDYCAGIWPWSCDNTVVQFNEVSGMKGTMDGEGYDSDYNCRHTLFQYNYSHNNGGGFLLICDDGSQGPPWNIGNEGTVVRYNLSVNDGLHTFNITGPCQNTQIYNNVFYLGKDLNIPLVASGNWGGSDKWPADTRFSNNVFYADGKGRFDFGRMKAVVFDHNSFWGQIANPPADPHAVLSDPQLAAPGSLSVTGYALRPGSPLRRAGQVIPDSGGRDFYGNPLPPNGLVSIGASQDTAEQASHLHLSTIVDADPATDLRRAISRHDLRFIGIYGFSLSVPGMPGDRSNPLVRLKGINAVEGTGDAFHTEPEYRLQDLAERYALRYNRSLFLFLIQSHDADLQGVQRQIDAELQVMERNDPVADARQALHRGNKRLLEVLGEKDNGIIGLTVNQAAEYEPREFHMRILAMSSALATEPQKPRIRRLIPKYVVPYNRFIYRALTAADPRATTR